LGHGTGTPSIRLEFNWRDTRGVFSRSTGRLLATSDLKLGFTGVLGEWLYPPVGAGRLGFISGGDEAQRR